MQGASRVQGAASGFVTAGGKEYTLAPRALGVYGEIEARILAKRVNIFEEVGKLNLDPDLMKFAISEAVREASRPRIVSAREFGEYMNSAEGIAHLFWIAARGNHTELKTFDDAAAVVDRMTAAEVRAVKNAIDNTGQEDALKN